MYEKGSIYEEVLEKIENLIEHKKKIQEQYLNDPERSDKYQRIFMLDEQIRALKELKAIL